MKMRISVVLALLVAQGCSGEEADAPERVRGADASVSTQERLEREAEEAEARRNAAIAALAKSEREFARAMEEKDRELEELQEKVQKLMGEERSQPPILVDEVGDGGKSIRISAGANRGMRVGARLAITRDGHACAGAEVVEVGSDWSRARVEELEKGVGPRVGDHAHRLVTMRLLGGEKKRGK